MSSTKPLLEGEATNLERALLESVSLDAPPAGARERATAAAVVALSGGGGVGLAGGAKKLASLSTLKILGVLAGALAIAALFALSRSRPVETPEPQAPVARETNVIPRSVAPSQTALAEPQAGPTATAITTIAPSAPSAKGTATPSIAAELAVLDRARSALASSDAAGALRILDEHDRDFPQGAFALEARVLRVHALVRLGRRDAATKAAQPILDDNPDSTYAKQVRDVLGK